MAFTSPNEPVFAEKGWGFINGDNPAPPGFINGDNWREQAWLPDVYMPACPNKRQLSLRFACDLFYRIMDFDYILS